MGLLVETLFLRPYVFGFVALFVLAGARDLGMRRTALFATCVWPLAWLAEFSSTRVGVPFGLYHYTGLTRGAEIYIGDVPLMDSLSFTFLAYASYCVARAVGATGRAPRARVAGLAGLVMMLLDVVIDPVALHGDRWFLGPIFYYPHGGAYFGVPLSNFVGWIIVGATGVGLFLALGPATAGGHAWLTGGVALYYAVLIFNLGVTIWIGEWRLLGAGVALHGVLAITLWGASARPSARSAWRPEEHERSAVPDVDGRDIRPQAEAGG